MTNLLAALTVMIPASGTRDLLVFKSIDELLEGINNGYVLHPYPAWDVLPNISREQLEIVDHIVLQGRIDMEYDKMILHLTAMAHEKWPDALGLVKLKIESRWKWYRPISSMRDATFNVDVVQLKLECYLGMRLNADSVEMKPYVGLIEKIKDGKTREAVIDATRVVYKETPHLLGPFLQRIGREDAGTIRKMLICGYSNIVAGIALADAHGMRLDEIPAEYGNLCDIVDRTITSKVDYNPKFDLQSRITPTCL